MSRGQLRRQHPDAGVPFDYEVQSRDGAVRVYINGTETTLNVHPQKGQEGWCNTDDGISHYFAYQWVGSDLHLWLDARLFIFQGGEPAQRRNSGAVPAGDEVIAPMPGRIVQVLVEAGAGVESGDRLIIMESMKMELVIDAPRAGLVKRISVAEGDQVDRGMRLLELEPVTQDSL